MASQQIQYFLIGFVHYSGIQRCKINLRSVLRIMSHSLANNRNGHITALGDTCPRMPTDIHCQGYWQIQLPPYFLQQMVHTVKFVGVLLPIIFVPFCNDGQEVFCFVYRIFVNNLLHTSFPFDKQLLPRLSPSVGKDTVLQILLPQICHVYKRHSPCIETEQEHVTGKIKTGFQ